MKFGRLNSLGKSRRNLVACLLLTLVTVAVYWQVAGFEFTNYDDPRMILTNPMVLGGLTWRGFWWALTTSWFEYWHPLTWLSHQLDCQVFGLNAGGPHLVSVGFHIANTVLLYLVLERMTGAWKRSAMVAALFALHPLHVESVAWVAERKDVLSGFFFILTLWAYGRYAEVRPAATTRQRGESSKSEGKGVASSIEHPLPQRGSAASPASSIWSRAPLFYALSLLFFACGLMSKPMVVTLPFVLLLLDYWPLGRLELRTKNSKPRTLLPLLREKIPFFALSVAACTITYVGVRAGGNIMSAKFPLGLRLANAPVAYVRYIGKMFWPADLAALYPMPHHLAWWKVGGALVVLAVFSLAAVALARRQPWLLVGWLWFLGTLVPVIGLVQVGYQAMADRYTYLPLIGLFIAVVWGGNHWLGAVARTWHKLRPNDGRHLINTPLKRGGSADVESENRFSGFRDGGETAEAVQAPRWPLHTPLKRGVNESGSEPGAGAFASFPPGVYRWIAAGVSGLILIACAGATWTQLQYWRNSLALWTHALAVTTENSRARNNYGLVLQESGHVEAAIAQYREAVRIEPKSFEAQNNLGSALYQLGELREATNHLMQAVRIFPKLAIAHGNLGRALAALGEWDTASEQFEAALAAEPGNPAIPSAWGKSLLAQNRPKEALARFAQALQLDPKFTEARVGYAYALNELGAGLAARGKLAEAVRQYREALRFRSDLPEVLNNLAWLLATAKETGIRNGAEAVQLAERACELSHYQQPLFVGTLAAAYAEAGQFEAARNTAQKAIGLAEAAGKSELAAKNKELLRLYEAGKPCRQ